MDAITSRPLSRLTPPPGFELEPSTCGRAAGAMTMHTNPFSFGLDIELPQPAATFGSSFSGGVPSHALRGDPFSSFSAFDPFSGSAAAVYTNPFSFGFDFDVAPPQLAGACDPFSGTGAAVHAYEAEGNPFALDPWGGLPPLPAAFDPFETWAVDVNLAPANAALPAADSPRTPVYGNPFTADSAVALSTDVPAPWKCDLPAAADDDGTCKTSTTTSSPPQFYASHYDDDDIEAILRVQEEDAKTRPSPDYLETTQGGRISPEARATLVGWMRGLARRYDLTAGTLHRAVSYADRFLSARALPASDADASERRLNLLGAAAIHAAAKYDDQAAARRLSAGAGEIARRGGFAGDKEKEEVAAMERDLLAALDYRLGAPTAHTFVEHFITRGYGEGSEELEFRTHDLANLSLLHYGCLELRPSAVAAAAISLAMRTLRPTYRRVVTWDRELEELTGYKPKDLERPVDAIRSLIQKDDGNGFDIDNLAMFYADPDWKNST
ncbi:unnamed protein product [Urochloa humidicola]